MEFTDVKVELVNVPDCLPIIKIMVGDQLVWYCKASEVYKEVLDYVLFRNSEVHHLIIDGIYNTNSVKTFLELCVVLLIDKTKPDQFRFKEHNTLNVLDKISICW